MIKAFKCREVIIHGYENSITMKTLKDSLVRNPKYEGTVPSKKVKKRSKKEWINAEKDSIGAITSLSRIIDNENDISNILYIDIIYSVEEGKVTAEHNTTGIVDINSPTEIINYYNKIIDGLTAHPIDVVCMCIYKFTSLTDEEIRNF